jgi:SAM-dependent methyltransferase
MEHENYNANYFDGDQKRGVLTLSNKALLEFIKTYIPEPRERALEIGCAYGEFTKALSPFARSLTGVDVSEYAISEGKKRYPELDLRVSNVETDPLPSDFVGAFDMVISLHTFEHFHNPQIALQRTFDAMKPGAYFFMVVPNPNIWIGKVLKLFGQEKRIPVFGDATHYSLLTQKQWAAALRSSGFTSDQFGRPFYVIKHPLLDRLFRGHYYTKTFQESGFELLFVCQKP